MKLYLVRHAQAVSDAEDPARPLSPKGRSTMKAVSRWLQHASAVEVSEIWHSPLVRARETAELLAEGLRLRAPLREVAGMLPEDSPAVLAAALGRHGDSLMMVGHNPYLERLASLLFGLDPLRGAVEFDKGTVLCLSRAVRTAPWNIDWLLSPRLMGGES